MRKIGYARVSTSTQNLDRQMGALRAERCHEVYREKASGKAVKGRPQLEKAIDALGRGDVLVVAEWDRATRSMMDGVHIIERIHARGAMIKVLDKPHLDLTTPIGRGFIAFLSALAEDERQRIVKRANEGKAPVLMSSKQISMLERRFICIRLSHPYLTRSLPRLLTMTFTTAVFGRSSSWRFGAFSYKTAPKGPPSSFVQHDADRTSVFMTQCHYLP